MSDQHTPKRTGSAPYEDAPVNVPAEQPDIEALLAGAIPCTNCGNERAVHAPRASKGACSVYTIPLAEYEKVIRALRRRITSLMRADPDIENQIAAVTCHVCGNPLRGHMLAEIATGHEYQSKPGALGDIIRAQARTIAERDATIVSLQGGD